LPEGKEAALRTTRLLNVNVEGARVAVVVDDPVRGDRLLLFAVVGDHHHLRFAF